MVPDPAPRSFHEYMEKAEAASPASFRGLFIQYATLRDRLQTLAGMPEGLERSAAEQHFFDSLTDQAQTVNSTFESSATRLLRQSHTTHSEHRGWLARFSCLRASPVADSKEREEELAAQAHSCREYAKVNAIAMRKVLESHDQLLGSSTGHQLLQACWDDTGLRPRQQHSFRCRFLHSPLLDELKALELVVESQFGPRQTASSLHEDEKASPAGDLPSGTRLPSTGMEHLPRAGAADGQPPHTAVQRLIAAESASPSAVHAHAASSHAELESTAGLDSNGQKPGKAPHGFELVQHWLSELDLPIEVGSSGSQPGLLAPSGLADPGSQSEDDRGASGGAEGGLAHYPSTVSANSYNEEDEDFTCHICLKVLYMPVGLSCGHKFCLPCVLLDAGIRDFRGNPGHLLHHKVKKDQPCPECLVKGVFQEAVDLERLGAFIKQQFPTQWTARAVEETERLQRLDEELAQKAEEESPALFSMGV